MRFHRIVFLATALLGLAAAHARAAATLSTILHVESRAGQVLVHVEVRNPGSATVYVPRALAADPTPGAKHSR